MEPFIAMDQLRERIGDNSITIEHLVDEVEKFFKDNDNLRKANLKNAEVAMKKEKVMKNLAESLRKEINVILKRKTMSSIRKSMNLKKKKML